MQLLRSSQAGGPASDVALTHALLRRVAAGELPATARLFRPRATLAFGRLDAAGGGFRRAAAAAWALGYEPVVRLGGGRAAAYDRGCVVVEVVRPQDTVAEGIRERFNAGSRLLLGALSAVGVQASVGELPGEYCPGAWSIHAAGVKLAGPAQRSIRGASLWTAFVAVEGGDRLREVLTGVYDALELEWSPATAGAAEDLAPGLTTARVEAALVAALDSDSDGDLEQAVVDEQTAELARRLEAGHRPGA